MYQIIVKEEYKNNGVSLSCLLITNSWFSVWAYLFNAFSIKIVANGLFTVEVRF